MNKLNKENVTGISALLVHAAKIDEIYSEHERDLIRNFIKFYLEDDDVDEEAFDDDVTEYCRIEEDPPDGDSSRSGSLLKFPSFFPTFIAECNTCSDEGSGTLEYEVEIGLSSFFLA